jgi:hypothetical protein
MELRNVRLDGEDRRDEIPPRIGDRPAAGAGLATADLLQQRRKCIPDENLQFGEVFDRRQLAGGKLHRGLVIELTGARPLAVQLRLRPQL